MFYIYHEHDDVKALLLPVAPKFPFFTSENTGKRELKKTRKTRAKRSEDAQKLYDLYIFPRQV